MPKPTSARHQSEDSLQSVTKKDMEKLFTEQREEMDKRFSDQAKATEQLIADQAKSMEQLLADQADVILEAVDERMGKKLDEKFNPVISKLDAVLEKFEDHRDEDIAGAEQLRRHEDQLKKHEARIAKLETAPA